MEKKIDHTPGMAPLSFNALFTEHTAFTLSVFKGATASVSIIKMQKEGDELIYELNKLGGPHSDTKAIHTEYADCFMCLFDSMAPAGVTLDDVKSAMAGKIIINKARKWKENGDGTYSHVKPVDTVAEFDSMAENGPGGVWLEPSSPFAPQETSIPEYNGGRPDERRRGQDY